MIRQEYENNVENGMAAVMFTLDCAWDGESSFASSPWNRDTASTRNVRDGPTGAETAYEYDPRYHLVVCTAEKSSAPEGSSDCWRYTISVFAEHGETPVGDQTVPNFFYWMQVSRHRRYLELMDCWTCGQRAA